VQAKLWMPLGEQGGQHAGAAADLTEIGARGREQVGDLTLLVRASGHQRTAQSAQ
jgi:hypothetical protein